MTTTEKPAPVVSVEEPDPFWDWRPGRDMTNEQRALYRAELEAGGGGECQASNDLAVDDGTWVGDSGAYHCSRVAGHPEHYKHIAIGGRYICGYWGGIDPAELVIPEGDVDPEPDPFELEVGGLYKFRNRPTLLMVVGTRKDEKVEVLDLTHQRYRVLDKVQLIPRRGDMEPTAEQLKWVAKFMADRRKEVRETAVKQRRDGFFKSVDDLNKVLGELGLEPHRSRRSGYWQPELRIRTEGMSDDQAKARLLEWLRTVKMPPGITIGPPPSGRSLYLNLSEES